jgi:hypothetical protein
MPASRLPPFSCFDGHRLVASGTPEVAALALKQLRAGNAAGPLLVFDNATGRTRDFDTRGSDAELLARVVEAFPPPSRRMPTLLPKRRRQLRVAAAAPSWAWSHAK